jgi:cytochrome b involved in lipid metabolism
MVHDHIYECNKFLKDHLGGVDMIFINVGMDCTKEFDTIHGDKAKAFLDMYHINALITTGTKYNSVHRVHALLILKPSPSLSFLKVLWILKSSPFCSILGLLDIVSLSTI